MKKVTIGILAHVDAGKTTLIEQLLVVAGKKAEAGRVDHGTAFLDTDSQERARGITITSKMCRISMGDLSLILMDTPGHVDFTAESERVLPVLDAAILVIGAGERIPAHAQYLFRLLKERSIPTAVFFNKMDLPVPEPERLLSKLKETLGEGFLSWDSLMIFDPEAVTSDPVNPEYSVNPESMEEIAVLDEGLLEQFLSDGEISVRDCRSLFRRSRFFPCFFGSALQGIGVRELLYALSALLGDQTDGKTISGTDSGKTQALVPEGKDPEYQPLGAYCYKILHDDAGQKMTFLRILSGSLNVRDVITYYGKQETEWKEKATQLRLYDGASYQAVTSAGPGEIVAVTGLSATYAGCGIGAALSRKPESSRPMLRFRLILPEGVDARTFLPKIRLLEEEEDTLSVEWMEEQEAIEVELYGEVQREILTERIRERFGLNVSFDEGNVVYRETLAEPSYGVGHFEPLRHYAEAHFLLEPLPRGTGILLDSRLSTDELDRNWQQTILNAVEQESLTGVLINAPLTDVKLTLVAGRAHKKHTEGGDFREAALRAVRQGLMEGDMLLLEPYVHFTLTVPQDAAGRALYDMNQLASESRITEQTETQTTVEGCGAISKLRNYMTEVRSYTHGEGVFRMIYDGYDRCPDQEQVVEDTGYQPEADLTHPAGSVFVDHGAADFVAWDEAPARMHIEPRLYLYSGDENDDPDTALLSASSDADQRSKRLHERLEAIGTDEIDRILQQASHANQTGEHAAERRNRWNTSNRRGSAASGRTDSDRKAASVKKVTERKPYLLVDGYNIIHAWEETRGIVDQNLDAARQILLEALTEYRAMITSEIIVVFDAYRVSGHKTEIMDYQNIHVVFTREAETADQYIARFTTEHEKKYDITVATSDGLIQLIIRGADAKLMSARELQDEVRAKKEMLRETYLTEHSFPLTDSVITSDDRDMSF